MPSYSVKTKEDSMKTALITGASGAIGSACAKKLAQSGYAVVLHYGKNEEKAKKVKEEITSSGGKAEIFQAEITDVNQVKNLINFTVKTFGSIDVLVNNAGIVKDEFLLMLDEKTLDKSFDVNVKGCFYCARQAALKMFRQKSGVIINVSSVSSFVALPGQSVYSATKGAINSMTKVLAKELAPKNIRVNAVAPGFIESEIIDSLGEDKKSEYAKAIPCGRFGKADEVASVVCALCDDAFSYVTGQVIIIDGGLSL